MNRSKKAQFIVLSMLFLGILGGPLLIVRGNAPVRQLLVVRSVLPSTPDAIVVPAGSSGDRLPAAAKLYKGGYAPLIILANDGVFSAWSPKYNRNLYQVEWAEEQLVALGVPRNKIVKLPYYGSATIFDALAAKKYLVKSGLKKIIVVTSDYHTRRTYWTFKHVLKDYPSDISVIPAKSIGVGTKDIVVEYASYIYYVLRYGLLNMEPDMTEIVLKKSRD